MSKLFDGIAEWLLLRALEDSDLTETVQLLIQRLLDGGIPLSRMVVGRAQYHPLIAVYDLRWDTKSGQIEIFTLPRRSFALEDVSTTPFGNFMEGKTTRIRANLTNPDEVRQFPIFGQLRDGGATDYAAWTKAFVSDDAEKPEGEFYTTGMSLSVCTNRQSGFSEADITGLERILVPTFLCTRMSTERYLARELLETYLGRNTGNLVLTGQSTRGDGETIDCVLYFSDMRGSSALSQKLGQEEYLKALNEYFDCVAGSVLDHGGEVLKFVGDGILAIFPIVEGKRPADAMCAAALAAAQEAYARASKLDEPPRFGTSLHVGKVVYGNVGTAKRLDYTATGTAVSLVCRCEAMTKTHNVPIISSLDFERACSSSGEPLGLHEINGFEEPVELFGWPITHHN